MDIILIEDLHIKTVIGCFAWEREIEQPLSLDLMVSYDLSAASQSDQLEDTISYAEICDLSREVIQQAQPKLIEHAAYLVMKKLFEHFEGIEKIEITIRKPAIIPEAQAVGIRLERQRHDFCTRTGQ
ncbi:dihydroneopterin aldolase [Acinetobacter rathckeae]|uniref:dihydroneopterin aldolase n=1 Tax=Acinetobacter rathckeae TaxID=2605272 RepID=UPI0018A32600|nr:dihydroneopterin aldolase [Acinetobacter rathckeae]MBF7687105.1 dihydroneopterin aldolase [Acinetobacter rathckeae]MBF7694543.1 dihydroneopterin aldolase [Acinetobacter rathckeae]